MPEGPLVHYDAGKLEKALQEKKIKVEFGIHGLKASEPSLRGLRVTAVEAYGKQFRIHFSDDRILLIHRMMWVSWFFLSLRQFLQIPSRRTSALLMIPGNVRPRESMDR